MASGRDCKVGGPISPGIRSNKTARYDQYLRPYGFAFQPVTAGRLGMQGAVPQIEEGKVDFGMQLKHQHRLAELTERDVTIETFDSDGTHTSPGQLQKFSLGGNTNEVTAVVEVLVGVDGRVKDGRIVRTTGNADMDAKILDEMKGSWKLAPAKNKKGKPVEKWGQFAVTFKLTD